MRFDVARQIADAVLYEGYVLYPYRASSAKNKFRWQFGVVAPRDWSENGGCEPWEMQTECLVEPQGAPAVDIKVRFLQVQARSLLGVDGTPVAKLEAGGRRLVPWEEGVEREADVHVSLNPDVEIALPLELPGEVDREQVPGGSILRERWPVAAVVRVNAGRAGPLLKLRLRVENVTPWPEGLGQDRAAAVRRSLVSTHALLGVSGGAFISLMDPPETAKTTAASCTNLNTWPVLVGRQGERDMLLSSPIILYDYPQVAPESHNDFFDGTEIDELLTLRVMTMTEEEKREARGTDDRAGRVVERSDSIPREVFEKLHGAVRSMSAPAFEQLLNPAGQPAPEQASVEVGTGRVSRGARVLLQPRRRADSMDMFLKGRTARVESVQQDIEGKSYVAVIVDDDPAGDLHDWYGRYFYFYPDELEIAGETEE